MDAKRISSISPMAEDLLLRGNKVRIIPSKELCCFIARELESGDLYICMQGYSIYRNERDDILAISREISLEGIFNKIGRLRAFIPRLIYILQRPDDWMMMILLILKSKNLIILRMAPQIVESDKANIPLPPSFLEQFVHKLSRSFSITNLLSDVKKEGLEFEQCVDEHFLKLFMRVSDLNKLPLRLDMGSGKGHSM